MGGTATVKRLGALALLALLLVPAPAGASHERGSAKEWVWGEWGDEKDQKRRERREAERERRRERYDRHHHGRNRYGLVYRSHRDRPYRHRYGLTYRPRPSFLRRDHRSTYVVHMTGDQVDPAGPADASGVANLLLVRDAYGRRGRVCYRLILRGTDTDAPLQAHLHEGRAGRSGPEVFDLDLSRHGRQGCRNVDAWLGRRIERSPGSFYLDVHTRTFGTGVVRGQLARAYRG